MPPGTCPTTSASRRRNSRSAHIPGAVFFDIDGIADHSTDLPHMMPTPGEFSAAVGALGIGDGDTVVVYDGTGLFSAPRAWWMLRAMGHGNVEVLDGGFPKWKREGRAIETGPARPDAKFFTAIPKPAIMRDFDAVMGVVKDKSAQMVDARSASRFNGAGTGTARRRARRPYARRAQCALAQCGRGRRHPEAARRTARRFRARRRYRASPSSPPAAPAFPPPS